MGTKRYDRSDLVLGMSLAEIMLLLVFAIAAATTTDQAISPKTVCESELDACKLALENARKEGDDLRRERDEWMRKYFILVGMAGIPVTPKPPEPPEAYEGFKNFFARGAAACDSENNVALEISILEGARGVLVRPLSTEVLGFLNDMKVAVKPGQVLSEPEEITRLLGALGKYGDNHAPKCRFDYVGEYVTAEDYQAIRDGEVERNLYPAGRLRRRNADD